MFPLYCKVCTVGLTAVYVAYFAFALTPGGYAGGLLLITPLGDLVRRRTLVLLLILITTILSIGLAVAQSWPGFQALNFLSGLFTVAPQVGIYS